jgi:hypothetical protein
MEAFMADPTNTSATQSIRGRSPRPLRWTAAACAFGVAILVGAPVVSADRLSDKDVKALIERINHERDRFEDQLDGKVKRGILRGPGGEVNVERYLDDLQENVGKLKDRFSDQYAASAEATVVLRQGSDIQRYMATQPPNFDGASEWNRLAASLGELAAAYGTTLPLADGHQARRMNDREVRKVADDLAKSADRFKKDLDSSLKKDQTVDKAARETAVQAADDLKQDAKELASALGDGRPASGEAKALFSRAAQIRTATAGRTLSPAAQSAWAAIEGGLDKVAQGFGMPAR